MQSCVFMYAWLSEFWSKAVDYLLCPAAKWAAMRRNLQKRSHEKAKRYFGESESSSCLFIESDTKCYRDGPVTNRDYLVFRIKHGGKDG